MTLKRRVTLSLGVTVLTIVPALVMVVVAYAATGELQAAATWASIPAIAGAAAAFSGGRRFAVIAAIVMGLLAPVSIVAGSSPVSGAALMALMCMVVGRLSRFGLHKSGLLVPVMMAWPLINPPTWAPATTVNRDDTTYLLWMALIFLVGGIIPALVVPWITRKRARPTPQPHTSSEVIPYTLTITVLVAVGTYYALDNPAMYGGAFYVAAILVLAPIGRSETLRPTLLRLVGTLVGSILVVAMVAQVSSLAVVYLIGLVMIVIALVARLGPRGWLYYVFMVPATASLNATSLAQVGQLGKQRVVDNLVGGVLVLLASAIAIAYSNWSMRHGHASDEDPEADAVAAAVPAAAS